MLNRTSGFTLLELITVVALVVVLFAVSLENLLPLRGKAERASVRTTLGNLRSAASMELVDRVLGKGLESVAELDRANPFEFLSVTPSSYAGTIDSAETLDRGQWGYHESLGYIIYRVRWPQYFEGGPENDARIRFRVELNYTDSNGNEQYDANGDRLHGIRIRPLDTYSWTTDQSEIERWIMPSNS